MHNDIFLPKCWYCCSWFWEVFLIIVHSAPLVARRWNLRKPSCPWWKLGFYCTSVTLCEHKNSTRTLEFWNHLNSGTISTGSGQRAIYSLPHWPRTDAPVQDPEYPGYTAEKRACEPWRRMLIGSLSGQGCRLLTLVHAYAASFRSCHPGKPVFTPHIHCHPRHHSTLVRLRPRFPPCAGRIVERNWLVWWGDTLHDHVRSMASLLPSHDSQLGSGLADTLIRINREAWWIITAIALSFNLGVDPPI